MTGGERTAAMAKVRRLAADGVAVAAACAAAGISEATWRRWLRRAPDGDPALLADAPRSGRPPNVAWRAESVEFVKRIYIRTNLARDAGSAALAWRMAAKDPKSPLTDAERAYILDCPGKAAPKSARDALRAIPAAAFARYRDPKAGANDGLMAPGWLRMAEDGSRRLRPGERQVWDDATVNVGVCVPWNRGGDPCAERYGVRVARFQLLAGIDCATDFCVGTGYVMRPSDGYRAEDVCRVMHEAWKLNGYAPDQCVMEGGSWQAERTLGFLGAAGVKVVSAKGRPNQKLVEGWFNRLWTVMSVKLPPSGQVGRFRGEMAKENLLWAACREGRRDPRGIFPSLRVFLRALDESVAYLNADKVCSRTYGTWVPAEKYAAEASKGHPLAGWLGRWALPVCEVRKLRRQGMVSVTAECPFGWQHEYQFAVADGWMFDGADVRVMFDPWRIRDGARIETADGKAVVAEAAPCVSPAHDPFADRCWLDGRAAARAAKKANRAAVAAQVAVYDERGAKARVAMTDETPEQSFGIRGGVPPLPPPADPAAAVRDEEDFRRELERLEQDESRLQFA